ncbi:mycofactocin dehydrogenase MftG [Mycolicibacterium sediminis]|uniref:Glucose-methanol-choline oxidoreductase n=1 Tax=Mycolicibacterium sediminis TaxID=1286180 RepID=A0A7I7QPS1_9MYCO|nr:mycofactocin system GMC family oxidoreductase MftG [Mycolicibacterium sediminis]BBY28285.1 glucose-methanol-choline oxidoreductase [Mycolicibacterium sediminis]
MSRRPTHADVLIVGAGSAGCVLAERLSADPDRSVVVVESGPGPGDPRVSAQIDDGLRLPIGPASSVVRHYRTTLTQDPPRAAMLVRGAVVGGSGAVNGGYFCRGLPADFDGWDVPGWSWSDVLPHFRAVETDRDFGGPLHGGDGPMTIRRVTHFEEGARAFIEATRRHGFPWIEDLNGSTAEDAVGTGVGAVPLNIDDGTRVGPGGAFLGRAAGRGNLAVLDRTRVTRVRFDGGRATGVECVGPEGARLLTADRIVLSAGAIGSAHLLLLSGVGPAGMLAAAGVPVTVDLPVGTGFADHPELVLPVDWPAAPGRPPLEAVLVTDDVEIRPYTCGFGAMTGGPGDDPEDRPHLGVTLVRPRARGVLSLVSADPDVAPLLEHRYDGEPADVAALEAGADLAHDLAGTGYEARQSFWSTSQHLCGSVPMGTDGTSALDERCRVRGVDGLWVVDGSIMPSITSRGPHATIVMIGHRAAEFVGE